MFRYLWKLTSIKRSKLAICLLFLTFGFIFHSWFIALTKNSYQIYSTSIIEQSSQQSSPITIGHKTVHRLPCAYTSCNGSDISYRLVSGFKTDQQPSLCFNGQIIELLSGKETKGRGFHIIKLNVETKTIEKDHVFDTYTSDYQMLKYLKQVPQRYAIIVVCYDECTGQLTPSGRSLLGNYGSVHIKDLQYRENFIMIGQLGLKPGQAIEKVGKKLDNKDKNSFGAKIEMAGCLKLPVGQFIPNFVLEGDKVKESQAIEVGPMVEQCGFKAGQPTCHTPSSVPVHVFIGKDHRDSVRMCINGTYYFDKNLNGAGRGLNVAFIDGQAKRVTRLGHFDTYNEDSSSLEIFLESMQDGDMIVVASFDDASLKLTNHVKKLFYDLGSSMIQNLKYRGSWYFVGRKGIKGFSSIENLEFPLGAGQWAPTIDEHFCMSLDDFQGIIIKPDPSLADNLKRKNFCVKYGDFADFCDDDHIYEHITSAPLIKPALANHPIYQTPILVIAGLSHTSLRMTLETLIMQPGIKSSSVLVVYDEMMPVFQELSELFGFKSIPIPSSTTYHELYAKALNAAWNLFPQEDYMVVIEQNLLLSPDFLHYMSQSLNVLINSTDLDTVSAWNPNGYEKISDSKSELAIRVEGFPGLAFILKRSIYMAQMKGKSDTYANNAWEGWFGGRNAKGDALKMMVPMHSRVYRLDISLNAPTPSHKTDPEYWNHRAINLDPFAWIADIEHLIEGQRYDDHLTGLIQKSTKLEISSAKIDNFKFLCHNLTTFSSSKADDVAVFYEERDQESFHDIIWLSIKCFDLNILKDPPSASYKGVFWFTYQRRNYFIISSKTSLVF